MKLTDALRGEHGAFYTLFDQIEEIANIDGAIAQIQGATMVLEAMVSSHAKLEEELLFSALEPFLEKEEGPLAVMYAEHKELIRLLDRIEEAANTDEAIHLIVEALGTARSHFQKEEEILFPMAQSVLGDEALTRLGKAWADARRVTIS